MSQEIYSSTLPAEQVLSDAMSPDKKAELIERLSKLKSALNQVETKMAEQNNSKAVAIQELDRRLEMLSTIGYETRANIDTILKVQLSEKYHPTLQSMLKNLENVNSAYAMILDGLMA
jgi:CTP-dependent riboflavin kinase